MVDRKEIYDLAQRYRVADGSDRVHIEHDHEGRVAAVWLHGARYQPLCFAEFAHKYLNRHRELLAGQKA